MKHLIIYSHLNPASFTKAIVDKVENVAKEKGDNVKIIDLYGDKFNPIFRTTDLFGFKMIPIYSLRLGLSQGI